MHHIVPFFAQKCFKAKSQTKLTSQKKRPQCINQDQDTLFCKKFCGFLAGFYRITSCFNPNEGDVWKPCQVRGGGTRHPPYLSWLWSKFWSKNHVSLKAGIIYNSFDPFSEFFFQKSQKNWRKLKTYQKVAKNERKF